jgi:probable rRNA maturation factor
MPVSNTRKTRRSSKAKVYFHNFPKNQKAFLRRSANLALSHKKGPSAGEVNFILVTNPEIRKLNLRFRKVDRFTDVISFRYNQEPLEGDIYISREMSKKQARQAGHAWKVELSYLIIHGILHLFDFKDYTFRDHEKMFTLQNKIFCELYRNSKLITHHSLLVPQ